MAKIIPFSIAVILVLAVGFYLFTSKITYNQELQNKNTEGTETTQATGISGLETQTENTTTPPHVDSDQIALTVSSPENNTTVTSSQVTVKGVTKAGAEVSVNEKDVIANSSGNFSVVITLEEGDNYIVVVAVDEYGQVAEDERIVTYTPAE